MVELPTPDSAIAEAMDRARAAHHQESERAYLGASVLGKPCERALWYAFRWAGGGENFDGRMLRLFETGHVYERRLLDDLRATGADIQEVDEETGDQWAVTALGGHVRGHLDGLAAGIVTAPKAVHVVECKTHNDRSFGQLKTHGVVAAKPEHHVQMQLYMHLMGVKRALYLAVNKNTDEVYSERVHYDEEVAARLMAKAERVVFADRPPQRISDDPGSYHCRYCPAAMICHGSAFARRNCRTCLHSTPRADGTWHCAKHDATLSLEEQRAGCGDHRFIPDLVPGDILDIDEADETIVYRIAATDETWTDGKKEEVAA